jgi:SAM-dependent methyltransferase
MTGKSRPGDERVAAYVPETRFGAWFQRTDIWRRYVVDAALAELRSLLPATGGSCDRVIDLGCGEGVAFAGIQRAFAAGTLLGVDIDPQSVRRARLTAAGLTGRIDVRLADASELPVDSASADLIVCHQVLHHVNDPAAVLRQCHRVLVPGGWLLVAESCREFLDWWAVRWLFRHPRRPQQTARAYVDLVRDAGFGVDSAAVLTPAPFWSQRDFGLARRFGRQTGDRPAMQVRIAARRDT